MSHIGGIGPDKSQRKGLRGISDEAFEIRLQPVHLHSRCTTQMHEFILTIHRSCREIKGRRNEARSEKDENEYQSYDRKYHSGSFSGLVGKKPRKYGRNQSQHDEIAEDQYQQKSKQNDRYSIPFESGILQSKIEVVGN